MYSSTFSRNSRSSPSSSSLSALPRKTARAPIHNPYDKFTQPEFDAWIGGITGALRQALGYEDEVEGVARSQSAERVDDIGVSGDEDYDISTRESTDATNASLAGTKAQYASVKGKTRDPEEGPGLGIGTISEPIELESDSEDGDGDEDEEYEEDYDDEYYNQERGPSSAINSSPTGRFTTQSRQMLVPSPGKQYGNQEEEEELFSDEEGDEEKPIELVSDEEENDENRPPESQLVTSLPGEFDTWQDEEVENIEDAEEEAEEEEALQPLDENTAFPPQHTEDAHDTQPVDIRDPWVGPQTYAEDFYSGGDLQSDMDGPLDPDRLNENDGSDISAFLTPGIITPNDPETISVTSETGSRTGLLSTPLRVALAKRPELLVHHFGEDEDELEEEDPRRSGSSLAQSSPSPQKHVVEGLYDDLVHEELGTAEDSHEVVDEEEDVMDEHDLPLGTSDLDIPEHDSDDIIEITHETLATKLSVPSLIAEEMADLTEVSEHIPFTNQGEVVTSADITESTIATAAELVEPMQSDVQTQAYTVHEVPDEEEDIISEDQPELDVVSIADLFPPSLVPEYDVEEPMTDPEESFELGSVERADSLEVVSAITDDPATEMDELLHEEQDLIPVPVPGLDVTSVVEDLLGVVQEEAVESPSIVLDDEPEFDLAYPERTPDTDVEPVHTDSADPELLPERERLLVEETREALEKVETLDVEETTFEDGVKGPEFAEINMEQADSIMEVTAADEQMRTIPDPILAASPPGASSPEVATLISSLSQEPQLGHIPSLAQDVSSALSAASAQGPSEAPTRPVVHGVPPESHEQQYPGYPYDGTSPLYNPTLPLNAATTVTEPSEPSISKNPWLALLRPPPSSSASSSSGNPPADASYVPYWSMQAPPAQFNVPLRPPTGSAPTSPIASPTVEESTNNNALRPPPINTNTHPLNVSTTIRADPYPASLSTPGIRHESTDDEEDELDSSPTEEESISSSQLGKPSLDEPQFLPQVNGEPQHSDPPPEYQTEDESVSHVQPEHTVKADDDLSVSLDATVSVNGIGSEKNLEEPSTGDILQQFDEISTSKPQSVTKSKSDQSNENKKSTASKTSTMGSGKANGKKRKRDDNEIKRKPSLNGKIKTSHSISTGAKGKGKQKEMVRQSSETPSASSSGASMVAKFLQAGSRASSVASVSTGDDSGAVQSPTPALHKEPFPPPAFNQPMLHNHSRKGPVQHQHGPAALSLQTQIQKQRTTSISSPVAGPSSQPTPSPTWQNPYRERVRVTRSHCQYHKISMPEVEDGPHIFFLVPGCALTNPELIKEEEIVDHGDATGEDAARCVPDIVSLEINAYVVGIIRLLVGPDKEQECYFLPQPGEERSRKIRRRRTSKSRGRKDTVLYGDSHTASGHPLSPPTSPRGAPVSTNGSMSGSTNSVDPPQRPSKRTQSGNAIRVRESLSPLSSPVTSDGESSGDEYVESPRKRSKGGKLRNPDGHSGSQLRILNEGGTISSKSKRSKQQSHDIAPYEPSLVDEDTDSATETDTPAKLRKSISKSQLKRTRTMDNPADEDDGERLVKKVKIASPERV
ncbi:hypothetical protein VNI00_007377 [Paramarasmius palmivorus]|uniref:Uncharacterized protein n=1 Tax=Paramarasmius palmivorus TaxID=297713 RepID=A0AAW0D4D2_9AGAR